MYYQCLENLLKINNMSVYRLSKETSISASTFTDWKNGRSVPKADKLKILADYFNVDIDYFFSPPPEAVNERNTAAGKKRATMIPIIGEIRAGSPIITNETLLGYESADVYDSDDFFYLKICGDSMKDIGMVDGSIVLFHKQQFAENGDIVACLVDGESATVKRFRKEKKNIFLMPENDEYSPIHLTTENFETGEARILGVALEIKIKL